MRHQIGFKTLALALLYVAAALAAEAHNIKGINYPTLATARLSSPTAAADRPVPIEGTELAVACFNVRNTSPYGAKITAVGLDLPGDRTGFALVVPTDTEFRLENEVAHVPDFPHTILDFALLTGKTFPGGNPHDGLVPSPTPTKFCVSGPFPRDADGHFTPIETLLNYSFVRFK
ncbi:MAG: hypothetical protein ABR568_21225, partial [Pyrinomonadaceae bacterium]